MRPSTCSSGEALLHPNTGKNRVVSVQATMKSSWRRFWIALAAVGLGNAIYLLLMPLLPLKARHTPFRLDWGLLFDFWICVVIFNLLLLFRRKPK